jgi:hypothetical protein
VEPATFDEARRLLDLAACDFEPAFMLEQLERIFNEHHCIRPTLLRADSEAPPPANYIRKFASLDSAYQKVFQAALDRVRAEVESMLREMVDHVESYDDFLVVNGKFTVLIQPSVPVPHGYQRYWYFRPDARGAVDITLGVPISDKATSFL